MRILFDIHRNNVIFTKALWKLLDILSPWEKSDIDHHQNLTLELSAHSPSDSQHMFQDDLRIQNTYPYLAEIGAQRQYMMKHRSDVITDHFHGFDNGQSITALRPRGIDRAQITERLTQSLGLDFFGVQFKRGQSKEHLPKVKMVTSFLTRG